jgi:murein DD-endopeptidase MepM/ murein hydrolase activator NlpD
MKKVIILYVCFAFSFALSAHADPHILLSAPTIMPGETLRVEVDGLNPNEKTRLAFTKGFYRMFVIGPDAQRALIGIKLDAVPGHYPLKLQRYVKTPGNWQTAAEEWVDISSKTFQIETVNFSTEKTQLMKWEHQESARIHKILRTDTAQQFWEGVFDYPVKGPIIGEFGLKRVRNETIDAGFHRGYDLRASKGTAIQASSSGIVLLAQPLRAHGRTVLINHGQGVMSIYLHMNSIAVKEGQKVGKGEKLGTVGSSGLSTAPHVHWGVYVHGVPVDGKQWTETEF